MAATGGPPVDWSSDVRAADWIVERLHPFAVDVGSLVPEGFQAYARVLHRAGQLGSLEPDELEALVELLGPHTGSPGSCWFGLWEGYGWMQGGAAVGWLTLDRPRRWFRRRRPRPRSIEPVAPPGPRVQIPGRSLVLYRGAIGAAAAFCRFPYGQSPNLWWPEDRAWCVASEIDLASTYLGGTGALVERVLHDARLEAVPAGLTDPLQD
jgi:hypothetical protein